MTRDVPTPREAAAILIDGCDHVETRRDLEERLAAKPRLTVKFGIDPTASFLHLGHAVVLHKMQQFVEMDHRVILLIGDFTALIGDPTGRNDSRPRLDPADIAANMRDYREQAGKILDLERIEVMQNSTWLGRLTMSEIIALMSHTTVAQMLARNDFANRYASGTPIALHEFLYPIAQAYDSVAMESDVELGGNDQLFNLLLGREYQRITGQQQQICLTTPILEGLDGVVRMSKSKGNFIGLTEPAGEQFGKLMSLPDEMVPRYAHLAEFRPAAGVDALRAEIAAGKPAIDAKKEVAEAIVARYHGADAAREARDRFTVTVQRRDPVTGAPLTSDQVNAYKTAAADDSGLSLTLPAGLRIVEAIVAAGFAASNREAERKIIGGGVKLDGVPVTNPKARIDVPSAVLTVGKLNIVRINTAESES